MFQFIRKRRPAVKGLIIGVMVGLAVAIPYAATAGWLCSGIRACPASWEPYAVVASIIFVGIAVAGVIVGVIGAKLYQIFDTALDSDGGYTTITPAGARAGLIGGGDNGEATSSERAAGPLPERSDPDG